MVLTCSGYYGIAIPSNLLPKLQTDQGLMQYSVLSSNQPPLPTSPSNCCQGGEMCLKILKSFNTTKTQNNFIIISFI